MPGGDRYSRSVLLGVGVARSRWSTATTPTSTRRRTRWPLPPWRLGLNIVVGFAGLLDLGYAAFFAIGAYAYGIADLVSDQAGVVARSGSPSPGSDLVQPVPQASGDIVHFHVSFWLMLPVSALVARSSACCSAPPPCGCAATTWPS